MTELLETRPKQRARRRWYLDTHGIRRLGSKSSGFRFVTADGKPVHDERTLARIRKLAIPPAWREVRIARGDSSPLQAIGIDKKGRVQYRYSARFRQLRDDEKFLRIVEFGERLPVLRRQVRRDLSRSGLGRKRVLAAIVRLLDQGFFRLGNEKSAKNESTFGVTTFNKKHVMVEGSRVTFDYVGKWKKKQLQSINDRKIAAVIHGLQELDGPSLFKYVRNDRVLGVNDRLVNEYIQKIAGGAFTAKDFRTWAGTLLCSIALAWEGPPENKRQQKSKVKKAVQATADLLGNTPTVCRKSYICPRLIDEYVDGRPFQPLRKKLRGSPIAKVGLSAEERALLKFFRETIADRRKTPRAA